MDRKDGLDVRTAELREDQAGSEEIGGRFGGVDEA
jgi:hypothetical protein